MSRPSSFRRWIARYWVGGAARVTDAGQTPGVERGVLLDQRVENGLRIGRRGFRQRHQVLGPVDEFAVQPPVRVATDPAARHLRRRLVDAPAGERRAVQHVLVAATDDDDRLFGRAVQIVAIRQPVLRELSLVPVPIREDQLPGARFQRESGDRVDHIRERPGPREVDAGTAPDAVIVVVGEPRDHRTAAEFDDARIRPDQRVDLLRGPRREHAAAADRERLHDARRSHRQDLPVDEDEIRHLARGRGAGREVQRRQRGGGPQRPHLRHHGVPPVSRRRSLPGRASVSAPSSITGTPFTNTKSIPSA